MTSVHPPQSKGTLSQNALERPAQRLVDFAHAGRDPKLAQARDAKMRSRNSAGHDAGVMGKIGHDIERGAVEAHPVPHPDANRGDLVVRQFTAGPVRLLWARDPDADEALAAARLHAKPCERRNDPALEAADEGAWIRRAPVQVEHDVNHPLARPMIGELAAAPAFNNREARLQKIR